MTFSNLLVQKLNYLGNLGMNIKRFEAADILHNGTSLVDIFVLSNIKIFHSFNYGTPNYKRYQWVHADSDQCGRVFYDGGYVKNTDRLNFLAIEINHNPYY